MAATRETIHFQAEDRIGDVVLRLARRTPERVFCHLHRRSAHLTIRYGQLVESAMLYANAYRSADLKAGATVLLLLPLGPELLQAFVGAILGGFVPCILAPLTEKQNAEYYADELTATVLQSGAGSIVVSSETESLIGDWLDRNRTHVIVVERITAGGAAIGVSAAVPEDVAFVQYSSGTTGRRKGVPLSHKALLGQAAAYARALKLGDDDVIVSWLPLYHDMGLIACFLLPLVAGVPVVLLDPMEWVAAPWLLFDRVEQHRGTLVWLPNFAFHHLARAVPRSGTWNLSGVRAFIDCSEPCKAETLRLFAQRFSPLGVRPKQLHVCYAMAEAVFAVTQTPTDRVPERLTVDRAALAGGKLVLVPAGETAVELLPVGAPLDGVSIQIIDEQWRPLPEGCIGEIALAADFLFPGYFAAPDETARAMRGDWFRTGDLGAMLAGTLYVTGRRKDIIIVHGRNFYAHDIEAIVSTVPGVKPGRVAALGFDNPQSGSEDVHIVAESEAPLDAQEALRRSIKLSIESRLGLMPHSVTLVPPKWIVKTSSGKTSRRENKEKLLTLRHGP